MFVGINGLFQIVHIDDTIPGDHYQCPTCGGELYIRGGDKKCRHFVHKKNTCIDDWVHETNAWHKEIQNLFPKENQEVVIKHNGQVHRADVLIDDIVIEIQNSRMSAETFRKRTSFFLEAGYRVAWIFNFTDAVKKGNLRSFSYSQNWGKNFKYEWQHPVSTFKYSPDVFDNDKFSIWMWLNPNFPIFERVSYMKQDELGYFPMKSFYVDGGTQDIWFDRSNINPKRFFGTKENVAQVRKVEQTYAQKCFNQSYMKPYTRYVGIKGHEKKSYTCPRKRQSDWIRVFGDNGCLYCQGCNKIIKWRNKDGRFVYEIECNFPNMLWDDAIIPTQRKETSGAPIIDKTQDLYPYR